MNDSFVFSIVSLIVEHSVGLSSACHSIDKYCRVKSREYVVNWLQHGSLKYLAICSCWPVNFFVTIDSIIVSVIVRGNNFHLLFV